MDRFARILVQKTRGAHVIVPAVLFFSLNSLFSCSGPLGTRTRSAMVTGAGVNEMRKFVRDMDGVKIGDLTTIETLQEITVSILNCVMWTAKSIE